MQFIGLDNAQTGIVRAGTFPVMPRGRAIFMIPPDHFDVCHAINPHMKTAEGVLHRIDRQRARQEWEALAATYRRLGFDLRVLTSLAGCPDMVFCANQTFPFFDREGQASFVLSNMADPLRHKEVAALGSQLQALGYRTYELPPRRAETFFEGMGDALWVPGRRLICGGYGIRTSKDSYATLYAMLQVPMALFELNYPKFYHLDTCLAIVDERTVLACQEGFTAEGWTQLHQLFPQVISVPLDEADAPGFACNAHSPDGIHVIIQSGNHVTTAALRNLGYTPVEVETREFIKSGGSVFCMKMQCPWERWSAPDTREGVSQQTVLSAWA